jgi:tetratricopeptide (TPR) repeat protein
MNDKSTLPNPFPGLRSFRSDEDYLFFGREEQALELVARLQRHRFIAVVGTSGQGKSSLVRCGLLSRLQGGGMVEAGAHWEIAVMHPGGDPFRQLAQGLLDAELYDREQEDALPQLLATLRRSQFGLVEAVRQARIPSGTNFLLVVDQFEEIFRYNEAGANEREAANDFVAALREASAQTEVPIYIVTTMRSDFIGDCSRFEGLAEAVNRGEYLIPRLSREQFKLAIEGPVRVAGGQITPRLLQRLLNDLGEEQDQLPCLQHALMRTWRVWQGRAGAEALDLEDYAQVGKMSQALSVHADEVYFGLATDRQRELCAAMFKALTVEGSEKRGIRRPRRLQTLCKILGVEKAELLPVIDAFRNPEVSFVMPPSDVELRDTTVIDLSHESLMRVWTRLRDWVDEEAKSVGIFRRLSESATLWRQKKAAFIRDPELSVARAWLETNRPNTAWAEQYEGNFDEAMAFLQASTEAAEEEVRAKEAARQHELEQAKALADAERRRAEEQSAFAARLKWLVRGLGLVAMLAVTAMFIAFAARRQAQENAQAAQAAEAKAQAAGALVDTARDKAERLVSFLLQDFYEELEPTGRLETVAKLAREAVAYFDTLPPELRSATTQRNRAIAELRLGQALFRTGKYDEGRAAVDPARAELERLYAVGDHSEATILGLAAALRSGIASSTASDAPDASEKLVRCAELLKPLTSSAASSISARIDYANVLTELAMRGERNTESLNLLSEAKLTLQPFATRAGGSPKAAAAYANVCVAMAIRSRTLGRVDEAGNLYRESVEVAERVLSEQPGNLQALRVSGDANYWFSSNGLDVDQAEAWRRGKAAMEAFELIIKFNPADVQAWNDAIGARRWLGELLVQEGRIDEALRTFQTAVEMAKRQTSNAQIISSLPQALMNIALWEGGRRNSAAAEAARTAATQFREAYEKERGYGASETWKMSYRQALSMEEWHRMDYAAFVTSSKESIAYIEEQLRRPRLSVSTKTSFESYLTTASFNAGRGNIFLGRWEEAEFYLKKVIASKYDREGSTRYQASRQWLTIALVRQGKLDEAKAVFQTSQLDALTSAYERGDRRLYTRWRFARGLYALALVQASDQAGIESARATLVRGRSVLDQSPEEAKQLSEEMEIRRLIDEELAKLPAKTE